MALKVNEIVIQAKVAEDQNAGAPAQEQSAAPAVPQSVKQEIIDLCMEKVKQYIERHIRDARR